MTVTLIALATLLTACAEQTFESSVSREDLEAEVAALYPPEDPSAGLAVTCEGGIEALVGSVRICRIERTDDPRTDSFVRVSVTDVVDDETRIRAVPFVPADRVAGVILESLIADGYVVTEVTCERELLGEVGASIGCAATPTTEGNDGAITATVTRVAGLRVVFDYELSTP